MAFPHTSDPRSFPHTGDIRQDNPQLPRSSKWMPGHGVLSAHLAWLELRGLRAATVTQRAYAVRRLAAALGGLGVLLLATETDLREWRQGLAHLAPVTVCTEIMHVHQFYRWAYEEGLIPTDPTRRLVRPRKPHRLPRPMTEGDLEMAVGLAPPMIRAWLVLASFAGMRAGEIARLQRQDVHDTADPPVIFIAEAKGGDQRIVPMCETVLRELRAYGLPPRGFVFGRLDGKPGGNSPARVSQAANRYLRSIGISDTFHACRHRACSRWYGVSHDIRIVMALAGHKDPATTSGYIGWSNREAVAVVRALDRQSAQA